MVEIREEYCKGCGLCIHFCPVGAITSKHEFNKKGYHPVEVNDKCIDCGLCYTICPDLAVKSKESGI